MITKQQALDNSEFHYGICSRRRGPRGGIYETSTIYRRNGETKTWKTREDDFRVPMKYGMYAYYSLTPQDAYNFHVPKDCPLRDKKWFSLDRMKARM